MFLPDCMLATVEMSYSSVSDRLTTWYTTLAVVPASEVSPTMDTMMVFVPSLSHSSMFLCTDCP